MSTLVDEIQLTRKKIAREGYDMSIGEIASIYESDELVISPPYQRLFRWKPEQKARFIESIFLNVPIPSIFVFTRPDGKWELVDGLQRVSTCLEFMGKLRRDGILANKFVCDGTALVPSLGGVFWPSTDEEISGAPNGLPPELQLNFKRGRMRVEILGPDTDPDVRFELFQRLNSGGSTLSEQEVRSCIIYSVNSDAFDVLKEFAENVDLRALVRPSQRQLDEQYVVELIVRIVCLRHIKFDNRMDVHEYLNRAIVEICRNQSFDWIGEGKILAKAFAFIKDAIGTDSFRKAGHFSLGLFEFISLGTAQMFARGAAIPKKKYSSLYNELLDDPDLERYTGAGIRGTDRWRGFVTARAYDYFAR